MGCLSLHCFIRIWSTLFCSSITGLKASSGCSRIFGFSRVRPTYSCPPLITTHGCHLLGLASPFVCRLHVRLVCGLALLCLNVLLHQLDCLASGLWFCGAVGPPATTNARFVFLLEALPQPRLLHMLLECPPMASRLSWHLVNERILQPQLQWLKCFWIIQYVKK